MNGQSKVNKSKKNSKATRPWMRLACTVCVILFCFISCIGCTSYVSTDEVDLLKNELTKELENLRNSNEAAQQEINTLKENNEAAQQEIDTLKENNKTAQQEIDTLKENNKTAQQEIDTLKANNKTAQQEIDTLKENNKTAQQEIDTLKENNKTAQQEIDSLKESNQTAQQEIDSLKESNQSAQQEIDSLKESNQTAQQEIDTLKGNNKTAQQEIDSLKENNQALQQELEQLKKQIEDLKNDSATEEPTNKIKLYIDQGHNPTSYHNAGATGNGLFEQDLTFAIGILLSDLLEEDGRFEICLSRPTENTVLGTDNASSLEARVSGAQEFGADYFISLHINAYELDTANGIEVFTAEKDSVSYAFGDSLLQGMVNSTGLRNRGMKQNPELYVLKNATMPAVLLEMGFISNSGDAKLLSENPELFAQGIYEGILAYLGLPAQTQE